MMIHGTDELRVCQNRLSELEARAEQIVTHPQKSRRVKEMEMAGVRGMIAQLQQELQAYELAQIQHSIHTLRDELQGIEIAKLPFAIQKTLDVLEEVTHVLQPAVSL
ncbi:MAG: hypothetical protein CVU38_18330 [Chloroflexi bacterium HGW-Chloroflexi-1]|nr:MAG: hypothetical protein CVU38_18330 [Chloroflexi bacterium HGW-Chloroflexi-1]